MSDGQTIFNYHTSWLNHLQTPFLLGMFRLNHLQSPFLCWLNPIKPHFSWLNPCSPCGFCSIHFRQAAQGRWDRHQHHRSLQLWGAMGGRASAGRCGKHWPCNDHRLHYVAGWWFGTWILWLSIQLGMSSSQLTNSYFSEGRATANQHRLHYVCSAIWWVLDVWYIYSYSIHGYSWGLQINLHTVL